MTDHVLDQLISLVPPPSAPVGVDSKGRLSQLQARVPFPFPDDFVEYSRLYGTGLVIFGPYSANVCNVFDPHYGEWIERHIEGFSVVDPDEIRRSPNAPSVERIVPCICSGSGYYLYLVHREGGIQMADIAYGDPNDVVSFPVSFSEFLLQLVTGTLEPEWAYTNSKIRGTDVSFEPMDWLANA